MPAGIKWREGENQLFIELTANWNLFFILLLFCLAHKTNNEKQKNEVRQQIKNISAHTIKTMTYNKIILTKDKRKSLQLSRKSNPLEKFEWKFNFSTLRIVL